MLRRLQTFPRRWMSAIVDSETADRSKMQFLMIPTNFPVSPYYFYSIIINKYLYEFIQKHKIRYIAAFPVRPGVYRRTFQPLSIENLQTQLGIANHNWSQRSSKPIESMAITHNNVMYDGALQSSQNPPIRFVTSLDQVYPVGTVCNINLNTEGTTYNLYLRAEIRLEAEWSLPVDGPAVMIVGGKHIKAEPLSQITSEYEQLLDLYSKIHSISSVNLPDINVKSQKAAIKIVQLLSGYLCTVSYFSQDQLYQLFKTTAINQKISLLLRYYRQYIVVLQQNWRSFAGSQSSIEFRNKQAVHTVYQNMKRIVGNVGEQKYIDKIRLKLKERKYPENIKKMIQIQLMNLESEGNHDLSRKKHFINLLSDYPFGQLAKQQFDVSKAKKILAQDHYGMQKLKRRILQFIAVSKLKGEFRSKVLLLYGPPGVGKTSIVKSIAKCLNRPYARISLGGEYDTSIIKGHRKTYVGAYPGKIWDSVYKSKVENPVILLDEIDKIVNRANGASLQDAVMEVLDPVQNHKFKDDFMDVEIDLSRALFICTANSLDTIFPPLLDRLERIQVAGYTTLEKMEIFKRYILKESMKQNGLNEEMQNQLTFTTEAAKGLIQGYCKEAGVRNLVRKTNKIFQKIALQYVKNIEFTKTILPQHLRNYIGLPTFHDARMFPSAPPPGMMIGLAYNNYGGSIMYIECANQGKHVNEGDEAKGTSGSLFITGNIHDVMKESCQLALSYSKYILSTFFNNHYLENNDVHLNFPEIEIGKDGPSAGVAITSALVSLALNKSAFREIAMTGEITLAGRVSPIGGVKQKTMGAKRQGIHTLIFPEDNRKDVEQLQAEIKQGMQFYFASHYFQVMQLVFDIKIEQGMKSAFINEKVAALVV